MADVFDTRTQELLNQNFRALKKLLKDFQDMINKNVDDLGKFLGDKKIAEAIETIRRLPDACSELTRLIGKREEFQAKAQTIWTALTFIENFLQLDKCLEREQRELLQGDLRDERKIQEILRQDAELVRGLIKSFQELEQNSTLSLNVNNSYQADMLNRIKLSLKMVYHYNVYAWGVDQERMGESMAVMSRETKEEMKLYRQISEDLAELRVPLEILTKQQGWTLNEKECQYRIGLMTQKVNDLFTHANRSMQLKATLHALLARNLASDLANLSKATGETEIHMINLGFHPKSMTYPHHGILEHIA